jgi:hypothetical protein
MQQAHPPMLLMVMLPPVTSRLDSLPAAASCCRWANSRAISGMLLDSTCAQHSTAQHDTAAMILLCGESYTSYLCMCIPVH